MDFDESLRGLADEHKEATASRTDKLATALAHAPAAASQAKELLRKTATFLADDGPPAQVLVSFDPDRVARSEGERRRRWLAGSSTRGAAATSGDGSVVGCGWRLLRYVLTTDGQIYDATEYYAVPTALPAGLLKDLLARGISGNQKVHAIHAGVQPVPTGAAELIPLSTDYVGLASANFNKDLPVPPGRPTSPRFGVDDIGRLYLVNFSSGGREADSWYANDLEEWAITYARSVILSSRS